MDDIVADPIPGTVPPAPPTNSFQSTNSRSGVAVEYSTAETDDDHHLKDLFFFNQWRYVLFIFLFIKYLTYFYFLPLFLPFQCLACYQILLHCSIRHCIWIRPLPRNVIQKTKSHLFFQFSLICPLCNRSRPCDNRLVSFIIVQAILHIIELVTITSLMYNLPIKRDHWSMDVLHRAKIAHGIHIFSYFITLSQSIMLIVAFYYIKNADSSCVRKFEDE